MISKHNIDAEVREYSLNTERAVSFRDVQIKSGGQCVVAQLNHVEFRAVSSSLLGFYAHDDITKPVYARIAYNVFNMDKRLAFIAKLPLIIGGFFELG